MAPEAQVNIVAETTRVSVTLCFSHLRWDFVFQRPQHLIGRLSSRMPVIFIEEPVFGTAEQAWLEILPQSRSLTVVRPHLPADAIHDQAVVLQRQLLDTLVADRSLDPQILWYYSPVALAFSDHLKAQLVIYDCMDELSAFKGADSQIHRFEQRLLSKADLVFTGGYSLYEAKRAHNPNTHLFPSGVDVAHFRPARDPVKEPTDQSPIAQPRVGFCGVIDERLDQTLLAAIADARPDWQIVMVGPIVKVDPQTLPRRPNIHYLGAKRYGDLPAYLAGWQVALMPFALNEATRFISPTKTPEYLAAGRLVVSTPIIDVVRQYGDLAAVQIAGSANSFIAAVAKALTLIDRPSEWLPAADRLISTMSWDKTWRRMNELISAKKLAKSCGPISTKTPSAPESMASTMLPKPHIRRPAGFDYLIVGAGFAGSVLAERLASDSGKRVMLVDRRPHIGGNAYDYFDRSGILVHRYGPHIFHTNSSRVVDYLSRFTEWRAYEHRVLARVRQQLLPVPINRTTVNGFFGLNLSTTDVEQFLAAKAITIDDISNSEDLVLSRVGRELYEALFRGYTRKQWGIEPSMLDKGVAGRIPVRSNDDDRYFDDSYQSMPRDGYTRMFEKMLDHDNISVLLQTDYRQIKEEIKFNHLIYTGPIDEYFDYRFGKLPYRSLRFEHRMLDQAQFQPVAVVNYPSEDVAFTRITEYKYLTGQRHASTSISYEFPGDEGDPYYPVPRPENARIYAHYQALADEESNTSFVGRLATYRYYNMDQVVAQALKLYERLRGGATVEPPKTRLLEIDRAPILEPGE